MPNMAEKIMNGGVPPRAPRGQAAGRNRSLRRIHWLALVLALGLAACGDSRTEQTAKIPKLEMDIPKPDTTLEKTKDVTQQTLPQIKKSALSFQTDEALLNKRLKEEPVADEAGCMKLVEPLLKSRDSLHRDGGMWGTMEQAGLQKYSPVGMQVDTKLNQLVFSLRHLCKTARGVPYDDLARFLNDWLETRGEPSLREELKNMGKEPQTIETFLAYAKTAKTAKDRVLDFKDIQRTILKSEIFVRKYEEIAGRFRAEGKEKDSALADTQALHDAVAAFLAGDRLLMTAFKEDTMSPDISRNLLTAG